MKGQIYVTSGREDILRHPAITVSTCVIRPRQEFGKPCSVLIDNGDGYYSEIRSVVRTATAEMSVDGIMNQRQPQRQRDNPLYIDMKNASFRSSEAAQKYNGTLP